MKKLISMLLILTLALSAAALSENEITEDAISEEEFVEALTEADALDDADLEPADEELPEPFTFRKGITWGMTQAEVLSAEGNPKHETDHDDVTDVIEIEDVEFGGGKCDIEYSFSSDDLFMIVVEYDDDAPVSFSDIKAKLTEKFGEPGAFSDEIKAELSEEALSELDTIASWTLADGTDVLLLEDTDDHSVEIMFVDMGW